MKKTLFIVIVVILLLGAAAFVLMYYQKPAVEKSQTNGDKIGSVLKSVNAQFDEYTNFDKGFKIYVPKTVLNPQEGQNCDQPVAVKVFEGANYIFIKPAQDFDFDQNACLVTSYDYYAAKLQEHGVTFALIVKQVDNDAQLEAFIKGQYGNDCGLGEKKPWTYQTGVFDVQISGIGDLGSDVDCQINYQTYVFYHPATQKMISFDTGQAINFYAPGTDFATASDAQLEAANLDDDVVNSLRFL